MTEKAKGFKPVVKQKLIKPLFKMEAGTPVYIKPTGPIYEGKQIDQKGDKAKEKPADLVDCVNLETGEEGQIIVPAVVKSVLEDTYKDNGYINLGFAITKGEKPEGKRYFTYTVDELDLS